MSGEHTRRTFLRRALAAATIAGLSRSSRAVTPLGLGPTASPRRVIVVGAGLTGLCAAFELDRAGHHVTIIEAQSRPGGRVLTLTDPFSGGLHADAGAARIHASHHWTLGYIKLFSLQRVLFYPFEMDFTDLDGRTPKRVGWPGFAQRIEQLLWMELGEVPDWTKINGGNDRLPAAFADRLREKIIYDAPVVKIAQDASHVSALYLQRNKPQRVSADQLICTVPFPVLTRIDFSPALSPQRRALMARVRYYSASRVFLQVRSRVWRAQRRNGFAVTDLPAEIWPSTFQQPGPQAIVQSYTRSAMSRRLTGLDKEERIGQTMTRLGFVFPGLRDSFVQGVSKCWSEDPWAGAAWSHPRTGDLPALRLPEGRVHFAGEHTSHWPAWMQGALEAGNLVARQVHRAI